MKRPRPPEILRQPRLKTMLPPPGKAQSLPEQPHLLLVQQEMMTDMRQHWPTRTRIRLLPIWQKPQATD